LNTFLILSTIPSVPLNMAFKSWKSTSPSPSLSSPDFTFANIDVISNLDVAPPLNWSNMVCMLNVLSVGSLALEINVVRTPGRKELANPEACVVFIPKAEENLLIKFADIPWPTGFESRLVSPPLKKFITLVTPPPERLVLMPS